MDIYGQLPKKVSENDYYTFQTYPRHHEEVPQTQLRQRGKLSSVDLCLRLVSLNPKARA